MEALKGGAPKQEATKSQSTKLSTHILALIADLLDCKKAMPEAMQPGELPLMRELSSLRRLPSLRDPAVEFNTIKGCSSARTVHWKCPEEARHDHAIAGRKRDLRGSRSPAFHGKPPVSRTASSHNAVARGFSEPIHAFKTDWAWDLRPEADSPLCNVRTDGRPGVEAHHVEVFPQGKAPRNHHDDEFSLDGWMCPMDSDMEASHATSHILQELRGTPRRHIDALLVANGEGVLNRGSYGLAKQDRPSNRMSGLKRTVDWRRQRKTMPNCLKQQNQVLSPLSLDQKEGMHYQDQPFFLDENFYARKSRSRAEVRGLSTSDIPFAKSPLYSKTAAKRGQRGPVKGNFKMKPLASPCSTSQRTSSHSSLSAPWEASSNQSKDELDLCELTLKNGCGYWSRCQRRSKTSLDMPAEKRFGCRPHPKSPEKMTNSSSKKCSSHLQSEYFGRERMPPLNLEALPLLSDPSACGKDVLRTPGIQRHGNGEESVNEGMELSVCGERPRSLSQKYRPRLFKDLVGQSFAAQALSSAICKRRIAPVYLFQGPRGTGKTSAARIFAAALNCISPEQHKPCGLCKKCIAFASGKSIDIREVDAASNNAVEKVKDLLQTAFLAPSFSQFKIFIIDECHMLTSEAWNVLVKLLEEPPRHVVLILTTTDPEKLPAMAISRCQNFPFPKIKDTEIVRRLETLVLLEKLVAEPGALELIAERADGSLRDAEIILDQLSLLGQRITITTVHELFGSVSDEKLLQLLDSALCSDAVDTVQRARNLIDSGVEPLDLMTQLATLITDILAGRSDLIDKHCDGGFFCNQTLSEEELERLRSALQVLSDSEKQLRAVPTDRTTWLTAALLQLGPSRISTFPLSTSSASAAASPVVTAVSNGSRQVLKAVNGRDNLSGYMEKVCSQKKAYLLKGAGKQNRPLKPVVVNARVQRQEASKVLSASLKEPSSARAQTDSLLSSRRGSLVGPGNLDDIWCDALESCQSQAISQLLRSHGKLLAVSISADRAVVSMEFDTVESKSKGENRKKNIASLFQKVLGLALDVNIALAASARARLGIEARIPAFGNQQQAAVNSQDDLRQSSNLAEPPRFEHKLGSLHYLKSHSQMSSPRLNHASSIRSFSVISTMSKSNRVADSEIAMRSLNSTPHFASAGRSGRRVDLFDMMRFSGSWNRKSRNASSLLKTQNEEIVREIVVDKGNDTVEPVQAAAKAMPDNAFYYDIEEENLRLESQSKYGGLLCWRSSQMEDEKVLHTPEKGRCIMFMKLLPCGKSERR